MSKLSKEDLKTLSILVKGIVLVPLYLILGIVYISKYISSIVNRSVENYKKKEETQPNNKKIISAASYVSTQTAKEDNAVIEISLNGLVNKNIVANKNDRLLTYKMNNKIYEFGILYTSQYNYIDDIGNIKFPRGFNLKSFKNAHKITIFVPEKVNNKKNNIQKSYNKYNTYDFNKIGVLDDEQLTQVVFVFLEKKVYGFDLHIKSKNKDILINNVSEHYMTYYGLEIVFSEIIKGNPTKYNYKIFNNEEIKTLCIGTSEFPRIESGTQIEKYDNMLGFNPEADSILFYYHIDESKASYIINDFCKTYADTHQLLENIANNDTSINYLAKFNKGKIKEIAYVYNWMIGSNCKNYSIYGIGQNEYLKGVESYRLFNTTNSLFDRDTCNPHSHYEGLLNGLKKELQDNAGLPTKLKERLSQSGNFLEAVREFLIKNHPAFLAEHLKSNSNSTYKKYDDILKIKNNLEIDIRPFRKNAKIKYNAIYENLIVRDEIKNKWKNEAKLYKVVKNIYDDAIYQFRSEWLGLLSLDIFIPSKNTAIEYQGQQHYMPVELFGGQEAFAIQEKRDKRKRKLCAQNNINLIEWKYNEPVSALILKQKIK
jgi:Na+-transporting methylmalonyl-CoA/oxaloacetate decarboxylase gamma subunit